MNDSEGGIAPAKDHARRRWSRPRIILSEGRIGDARKTHDDIHEHPGDVHAVTGIYESSLVGTAS